MIRPETEMKDSGIECINAIPKRWTTKRIKNLFSERNEKVDDAEPNELLSVSEYYGVAPRNEKINSDTVLVRAESLQGYKRCEKNDLVSNIMLAWKGAMGISQYRGVVSPSYSVYIPKKDICSQYYHYLFRTDAYKGLFKKYSTGIIESRLRLYTEQFFARRAVVPPLYEQQAIADYLDQTCSKIDEIIAEAKASIDEYKELRIAVVNDAVTHGIDNNAVKDSNVDWIGRIPDNWKIIITKRLFKIKKDIARKEGYTVLSITQKGIVPKVFGGKGQFAADYSNYQLVNKGDFAMNHMDLLTGWLDISEYDGVTSPDYRVFVPTGHEDIYTPYYKYVMQNCYSCKIYYGLGHGVAGVGRWRLPADMFLNFKLPMPPKEEQKKIADFLDKRTAEIDSLISEKESLINDLEAYKKSLIYEVVTGKRRVV